MSRRTLSPSEVREVLHDLVQRLAARGDEACVYVIGGAAIALINPARTATQDVDGYIPFIDATDVIDDIQRERGLEAEWFNWHAQGLQPPIAGPDMWHEVLRVDAVRLMAATTDALLAMKLNAARGKDTEDICFLMRALGITSLDQAEALFESFYPGDALTETAVLRVEHCLANRAAPQP